MCGASGGVHPQTQLALEREIPLEAKRCGVFSSWWRFHSCLLPLFLCCGGPNTYKYSRVHSQIFFATQSQPYSMGKSGNTNWPGCPNWGSLVNTWSLVACDPCLLFAYVDLTELLLGSLWLLLTITLVYPDSFSLSQIFPAPFVFWLLRIFQNFSLLMMVLLFFRTFVLLFFSFKKYFVWCFIAWSPQG